MKVQKFIEGYNKSSNKESFLNKHITNKYVSFENKISDCEFIARKSCYRDGIFQMNSVLKYLLYCRVLFSRYTDLEFEDNILNEFDTLEENGLFEELLSSIPIKETTQYKAFLEMKINDICSSESNFNSIIVKLINNYQNLLMGNSDEEEER